MHLGILDRIDRIPAGEWNALAGEANPFLRHEFLSALEHTGCVGGRSGWQPRHLVVHAAGPGAGPLLGAVPLYLKRHSYGEYVFDWAWAGAYERAGLRYYPKLVAAVPFTPATGPRLLAAPDRAQAVKRVLVEGALAQARELGASSLHWLFTNEGDTALLERHGHLRRVGCQFHWRNAGYGRFDDFLAGFSADKRKKVRQERRYVREAGVTIETLSGAEIEPGHWDRFYQFYLTTIQGHGAIPYLNREFFHELGRRLADRVVLVLARRQGDYIAGALNLRGTDTLYGRYWGALRPVHGLHFEVCYYAAIEFCIARGLRRFEAGAQGEHKLARGLLPTATYSAHWLSRPEFRQAVADFVGREGDTVGRYMSALERHSPFKEHD